MLTEDYIMRMINQALAVIMAAMGFKKAGKYDQALQTFDQAIESLLGLNARLVSQLDDSMLLDRLTFMGTLDLDRLQVLADIYFEEAEVFSLLGQSENSQLVAQRSLRLYLEVILADEANLVSLLIQKIEALRRVVSVQDLPVETRLALQDYLDRLIAKGDDFLASNGLNRNDLQNESSSLDDPDLY
jgi:tetratricopeptide (TPR) repeat protein